MLRILSSKPTEFVTRGDVKRIVEEKFSYNIKVWTFLKKLESCEIIQTEKVDKSESYKLTITG
jgi:hypothetical protein